MTDKKKSGNGEGNGGKKHKEIDFHYLKTSAYRSYHLDGVFGGLTPAGHIYMELFLERKATPQIITHKIVDGSLSDEIRRVGKVGVVREIEAGVIMNIDVAKLVKEWLEQKINEHKLRTTKGSVQ